MGGIVGVVVRTPDGKLYPMRWGTNSIRNITMPGWLSLDPEFWDWDAAFARWEGENRSTLAPVEYGLVVVDHQTKRIISRQNFTAFEVFSKDNGAQPPDLAPFTLDHQGELSVNDWNALRMELETLGFVLTDQDRKDWQVFADRLEAISTDAQSPGETLKSDHVALQMFVMLLGFNPKKVATELANDANNLTCKRMAIHALQVEPDWAKSGFSQEGIDASIKWLESLRQK